VLHTTSFPPSYNHSPDDGQMEDAHGGLSPETFRLGDVLIVSVH
jgi:hypothetical protein